MISKVYSGSEALKTDFTRTGKRTKIRLPLEGYDSAVPKETPVSNFFDGARQVGLLIVLLLTPLLP